jgi:very-short-patch-repair endonuclease
MNGKAIAVILKPLIDLHGEPKNWATAAPLYIQALADIPPELLAVAVRHALASNPYFPKPADLRLSIVDELREYRRVRDEERRAKALPPPQSSPPVTEEDIVYVDRLVAQTLGAIAQRSAIMKHETDGRLNMMFLPEGDPRRLVWERSESPLEQQVCCGLFLFLGCKAVEGDYDHSRRAELAEIAGDAPAAFVFAQHWIGRSRADFMIVMVDPIQRRSQRFVVECDGKHYHSSEEQIERDAERDRLILAAGYKDVIRCAGSDVHYAIEDEIEKIGRELRAFGIQTGTPADCADFMGVFSAFFKSNEMHRRERSEWRAEIMAEERAEAAAERARTEPDFVNDRGETGKWRDTL